MKQILIVLLAITVVSIMGTNAMAETDTSITSNATLNKEYFADHNARYNLTLTTPEGEQAVRVAYTALLSHQTDIPYSVVETIYSVEQKGYSNKYIHIINQLVQNSVTLYGMQTYDGSNIITAPKVTKYDMTMISPKTIVTVYVHPETRTTTTPEGQYVFTIENVNTTINSYAVMELVAKSDGIKSNVEFDKAIEIRFDGKSDLVPFYSETGTSTAERIFKCTDTFSNGNPKLGKDQNRCFSIDGEDIIVLTTSTGIHGLHPKTLNGDVSAKFVYRTSDFNDPITNTVDSYKHDLFNPHCVDNVNFVAKASFDDNGNVIVDINLTEEQKEKIDEFSILLVDMNRKLDNNIIATTTYQVQGLENQYVIDVSALPVTFQTSQIDPLVGPDGLVTSLDGKTFGVIVQAVGIEKTLANKNLYYYDDMLYFVYKLTYLGQQQAVALGSDIPVNTMFFNKGKLYKPMGDTITMYNESRCKLGTTPIIIANLPVSGTADFAKKYGYYQVNIDGPNMVGKLKDVVTRYVLVSDDGEINHIIRVSSEDISLVVKGSKIGGHGDLTIYAYSGVDIVAIGELEFLRSYPVHRD